ncbi:cytidine deaminase-like protein [Zopfochytrium polystomum]|nr:cytidine deaminase-like protein [Zopfochytrium polystomum]
MAVPPEVAAASIDRDPGWAGREAERAEKNRKSVLRLIMNNPIAMTLFIPQWDHGDIPESDLPDGDDMDDNPFDASLSSLQAPPSDSLHANGSHNHLTASKSPVLVASATVSDSPETVATFTPHIQWPLDESVGKAPGIASRWDTIKLKFRRTCVAISLLDLRYQVRVVRSSGKGVWSSPVRARIEVDDGTGGRTSDVEEDEEIPKWARHGMVLAHIAARRTDDPKLGVGSVLVDQGRYISIGWNGYPKKSQHLDYPQAGADDSVEDEELKYDYILHSEQNALLWRNPTGVRLDRGWLISTKMPCDECSPMVFDFGFTRVITIPQIPKSLDDPARLRGLTYEKISSLMERVFVFDL